MLCGVIEGDIDIEEGESVMWGNRKGYRYRGGGKYYVG